MTSPQTDWVTRIVIFGAASAIAQAMARRWARQGAALYLVDRNAERLQAVAGDLTVRGAQRVTTKAVDLNELDQHGELIDEVMTWADGQLDMALFAQGYLGDQQRAQTDPKEAQLIWQTNFEGVAGLLTELANRFEKRKKGTLIVISSVAGDRGRQSNYVYGAAKGALAIFAQGLHHRLAATGVQVLVVKPGFVDTPMTADFKKGLLWVKPERVARDVLRAVGTKKGMLYTPWWWRWVMLIIKLIPERIFVKLSL